MKRYLIGHIALPQDHGAWVFILSPLLIGGFAGGSFNSGTVNLFLTAMAVFLVRQPMTILVKVLSGRRSKEDLAPARFWIVAYILVASLGITSLFTQGYSFQLLIAGLGLPVFVWHLWLVSRRSERRQAGVEIAATGILSLAAPSAFWIGQTGYSPSGWWLWILAWLQASASIIYAYLRLGQRDLSMDEVMKNLWRLESRAFIYSNFNLVFTLTSGWAGYIPRWIFVPYLLQWLENHRFLLSQPIERANAGKSVEMVFETNLFNVESGGMVIFEIERGHLGSTKVEISNYLGDKAILVETLVWDKINPGDRNAQRFEIPAEKLINKIP